MSIVFRDRPEFPFNGGRGIRVNQLDGLIPEAMIADLPGKVDDIRTGRLGYHWRVGLGPTPDHAEGDFLNILTGASSEYHDLTTPEFAALNWFAKIATPLSEPESRALIPPFYSTDLLRPPGLWFRRHPEPGWINGVPHRVYVSRAYATTRTYSAKEFRLEPQLRLSRYGRRVITTNTAAYPDASAGWSKSYSPVVALGDFAAGANQHVHLALPHGTTPAPTRITLAAAGAPNIVGSFALASGLLMFDGVPYAVYSSTNPFLAATYSGQSLIVLPERDGIDYFEAPTVFPNEDLGFTWYAGVFSRPSYGPSLFIGRPIVDELAGNADGVNEIVVAANNSTTRQIVLPVDADGGVYSPQGQYNNRVGRFFAVPANVVPLGLSTLPSDPSYGALADYSQPLADGWARQRGGLATDPLLRVPISIGGEEYHVFLETGSNITVYGGRRVYLRT